MKKFVLLLALCALPVMADKKENDKNPSQMVMAAYESVLTGAHTMLTDTRATKYLDTLANGIEPLAEHLDEVNDLADDIENAEEWNAALAESQSKLSALMDKVKAAALPFANLEHEMLGDALEDLADELEDMQEELQPKELD